jgi:adenylate cyclase
MDASAKIEINEWIVRAALAGTSENDVAAGVCERLTSAGLALVRLSVATNMLDPIHDARLVRWVRGQGTVDELVLRTEESQASDAWTKSPFFYLLQSGLPLLRRRLDASYRRGEFSLLDTFQDQGVTDYVAFREQVGDNMLLGEGEGLMASWSTDAPGGFSASHIDALAGIMPVLTLAFMLRTTNRAARTLIATYLGKDAAERVLAGNVVRGRAQTIQAIVWYSDLMGFTRISDTTPPEVVLAMLNDYAEAQVDEIESHHGHVLKFIGDGILAIFPDEDTTRACRRALAAAVNLRLRIAALNGRRQAAGLPVTDTHLALHVGELLYGNLGSPRRLDFTVLGSAVNVAERIEALCGSLDQKVIVSWAFADAAGDARSALVSLGRYAMKGIAQPQELFTLEPPGV